jgi:hypothetical protein
MFIASVDTRPLKGQNLGLDAVQMTHGMQSAQATAVLGATLKACLHVIQGISVRSVNPERTAYTDGIALELMRVAAHAHKYDVITR